MKKLAVAILVLSLISVTVYAQDNGEKQDLTRFSVDLSFDRIPPIVGVNNFTIKVKDRSGTIITNADITVTYYMNERMSATRKSIEMPRHGASNTAEFKDTEYKSQIDFSMPGPWIISVKTFAGGKTEKTEFRINVK